MRILITIPFLLVFVGCATIVDDPDFPLTISFSDGSSGHCSLNNKRGSWSTEIPATNVLIQGFDEGLAHTCRTEDGRRVSGWIRSELEGEEMAASVIFWRLGITDATIDKQGTAVIPIRKATANAMEETPTVTGEWRESLVAEYLEGQ